MKFFTPNLILVGILMVVLAMISYRVTYALFSSSATNGNNSFSAVSVFIPVTPPQEITPTVTPVETSSSTPIPTPILSPTPSVSPTPTLLPSPSPAPSPTPIPGKIVINEIFQGADAAEWIELHNTGGVSVNVSGWKIKDSSAVSGTTNPDTLPNVAPIAPGGFAIVVPNTSTVIVPGSAIKITLANGTIANGLNVAGDSLTLSDSLNTEIDKMSYGNDTSVFSGITAPSGTNSLSRVPNGIDTNTFSDWQITTTTIGITN